MGKAVGGDHDINGPAQVGRAEHLRALHDRRRPLLLPNAWDAASARIFEDAGFDAVATTSGGVAWALGHPDGERAPLDEVLAAVSRMVRVLSVPLTVDFEGGYADSAPEVAANVRRLIDAGAVGLNLEDGVGHASLREVDVATARIAAARDAARAAGVPIVINARIDAWIIGGPAGEEERIAEALGRARAYLAAGADCIYPIAVTGPATIARLCAEIPAPVNIGARPGLPDLGELGRMGVARVSTATRLATLAYATVRNASLKLRETARFDAIASEFGYEDLQRLFLGH